MPLDDIESDSSYNEVTQETQKSYFSTYLIGNLTNIATITLIQPISQVSEIDPEFDPTMQLNTTVGGTWVYFSGFRMTSRGFILVSMELNDDLRISNTTNITNSTNTSTNSTNNTICVKQPIYVTNGTNNTNGTNSTNGTNITTNVTYVTICYNISNTTSNNNSNSSLFNFNIFGTRRFLQNTTNSSNSSVVATVTNVTTTVASSITVTTANITTINKTNAGNSSNITTDFFTLFKPTPAQIKLKFNAYNKSVLVSHVAFYNYTDGSLNVTELNYSTNYRVYYTVSSENPAVYCLLGKEVRGFTLTTLDKETSVSFARILERYYINMIILITILIILS